MRLVRLLVTCLVITLIIGGLFLAAVFSPVVQTWYVQRQLNRQPGMKASVESVWAGLSSVEVTNLRLERDGFLLVVPELEVKLPTRTALFDHRFLVQSLLAKGWTLNFAYTPPPAPAEATEATEQDSPAAATPATPAVSTASKEFRGILSQLQLPVAISADGIQLEGDLVIRVPGTPEPVRIHVVTIGGGLAPGRTADLSLDAAGTQSNKTVRWQTTVAHGRLLVSQSNDRQIAQLQFKGTLSSEDESLPKDFTLAAAVSSGGTAGAEVYAVDLIRGERRVLSISAHYLAATAEFAGTWAADIQPSELATFIPGAPLPAITGTGAGTFSCDPTLSNLHVTGELKGVGDHWATLGRPLAAISATNLEVHFDATRSAQSLRIDRLALAVATDKPVASFQSQQSFTIDEKTGALKPADAKRDLLEGHLNALPVEWLPAPAEGVSLTGGGISGAFSVRVEDKGFSLQSKGLLKAAGVMVRKQGTALTHPLELSAPLTARFTRDQGWEFHGAPFVVTTAGRRLATVDAKLRPLPEPYRTLSVSGQGEADLDAVAAQPGLASVHWLRGHTITGDFSANLGAAADLAAHLTLTGHTPGVSVAATIGANIDDYRSVTFHAPLKLTRGTSTTELSIDGTWLKQPAADQIDISVEASKITLDDLRLLGGAIPLAGGATVDSLMATTTGAAASVAGHDQAPFWGDLLGRLRFEFHDLQTGTHLLHEVAGTFGFAPDALRLNGGRAAFSPISTAKTNRMPEDEIALEPNSAFTAEGTLAFAANESQPYALTAKGGVDVIDAARLFGQPAAGHEPVIEGHWGMDVAVTGAGSNLADLWRHRREEYHLTSTAGSTAILKTSVADALPDAPTPVSDTAVKVGSAVTWLFGVNKDALNRENHLSKQMEAVLDFTYQTREIAYDKLTIDAVRDIDQTLQLSQITMLAANQRLTGSGDIAFLAGVPLRQRPIALHFTLALRGASAERLATANLLAPEKDADGFRQVREPLRFGGTLDQLEKSPWRDLLVKAALAGTEGKAAAGKK